MAKESGVAPKDRRLMCTKETMQTIKKLVSEYFNGLAEILIKVNMEMMSVMVMVKWYGLMEVCTKENGNEESKTVLERWSSQTEL
jgi:hypothetical protein